MATVDIAKLQANLMTDENTSPAKQVLESTIMVALPIMFGEMPATQFTNTMGSTDAAGNVSYYKTKIPENNVKAFAGNGIGDLDRFNNIVTEKILVAIDIIIESPVTYYSNEVAMSASGILSQVESGMTLNMAETREISILKEEWDSANTVDGLAAGQVKYIDLDTITTDDIEKVVDGAIAQLRKTKDTGINKVSLARIVIKLDPVAYQKLLKVRLIIPGNTQNEQAFLEGKFNMGKYKGVIVVEDVYMEDAESTFVGSITMIGAIASPWRPEGVANERAPGESAIYLLNPQVRYRTKAIYPKHVIVLSNAVEPANQSLFDKEDTKKDKVDTNENKVDVKKDKVDTKKDKVDVKKDKVDTNENKVELPIIPITSI